MFQWIPILALSLAATAQQDSMPGVPAFLRHDLPCTDGFQNSYQARNRAHGGGVVRQFELGIKTMPELRQYIQCFSQSPTRAENFTNIFEERIRTAANLFSIPTQLISCLAFREGQWNVNAESKTGVRGSVQMTGNTIDHVNEILSKPRVYPDIRRAWDRYFLSVRDVADQEVLRDPVRWAEYVPQQLDRNDPRTFKDVEIAFAANGAYLKFLQGELDKRLATYKHFNMSMLDYSLMLVAMYNGGAEGVLRYLDRYADPKAKKVRTSLPHNWEDEFAKLGLRGEGVEHVKAIRRCMSRGVMQSLDGTTDKCSVAPAKARATPPVGV